ncbi:MAG: isoprenyl transferase [Ectothiorhodospiraceae bacterium]|nr:isoprenyl transferase [Chromatiales bacterium]MCP5156915.1 isoprenyl transferase [Ectothiorhodospiraceae bacterium]
MRSSESGAVAPVVDLAGDGAASSSDTALTPDGAIGRAGDRVPVHVAVVMDGNGRWASRRRRPRMAGHRAGVETVREVVAACGELGVRALTLFAFSSENWRRPQEEVGMLMNLFMSALEQQVRRLHEHDIRLRVIGERRAFSEALQGRIDEAEALTRDNSGLDLVIAANYGGRWDVTQAVQRIAARVERGELAAADVDADVLRAHLSLADLPEPDLFIRTGGEQRLSNFLLWDLAYTELYFTEVLWPDFDRAEFERAIAAFGARQRRFGRTGEQVESTALEAG